MDALKAYMGRRGWNATQLAAFLGVEISTVTRLMQGKRGPSLSMALHIEKKTAGAVPLKSWKRHQIAA